MRERVRHVTDRTAHVDRDSRLCADELREFGRVIAGVREFAPGERPESREESGRRTADEQDAVVRGHEGERNPDRGRRTARSMGGEQSLDSCPTAATDIEKGTRFASRDAGDTYGRAELHERLVERSGPRGGDEAPRDHIDSGSAGTLRDVLPNR